MEQLQMKKRFSVADHHMDDFPIHYWNYSNLSWKATFFDQAEDAIAMLDLNGRVIILNSSFEQLFGYSLEETSGHYLPIFPKTHEYERYNLINKVINGEKLIFQSVLINKQGQSIPSKLVVSPIYSDAKKVIGILCTIKDLSELVEYKTIVELQTETMETEEKLFLDIIRHLSEVFVIYDLVNNRFKYISPSIEKVVGLTPGLISSNPVLLYEKFQTDNREELLEAFKNPGFTPKSIEFQMEDKESEQMRWYRLEITPIIEHTGEVNLQISVLKDITELIEKVEQIKQLDQLGTVGQLAAGIAHEVKNPLTSVKGFVQLLSEQVNNQYGDIILSELERIEYIMNEFLMLAKPKKELNLKAVQLNNIINDVLSFMKAEAILHKVELRSHYNPLPLVACEVNQIKQVIINLVKNAIEAMPSGGNVHITTKVTDTYAIIEIKDEGIGISKQRLKRLSEPFFSDKENGTGLGLMVSHKIIEDHKGKICFTSEEGKGTCAEIFLPFVKEVVNDKVSSE